LIPYQTSKNTKKILIASSSELSMGLKPYFKAVLLDMVFVLYIVSMCVIRCDFPKMIASFNSYDEAKLYCENYVKDENDDCGEEPFWDKVDNNNHRPPSSIYVSCDMSESCCWLCIEECRKGGKF
jgi:hypothetical protein